MFRITILFFVSFSSSAAFLTDFSSSQDFSIEGEKKSFLDSNDYDQIMTRLSRCPAVVHNDRVVDVLSGRNIFISGGAGSIGGAIVRQVCQYLPNSIIVYDHSENNVFRMKKSIEEEHLDIDINFIVGDILNEHLLESVFKCFHIDVVYHSAAYKHVSLMEEFPYSVIHNNVEGTLSLLDISEKYNVSRFVNISTDKAVNPINFMGATKRACELMVRSRSEKMNNPNYLSVRFGNVLGSSGSVGPIFEEQLRTGRPLTLTDPEATRYLMTITEAAQLVLVSSSLSIAPGRIYLLDMGRPIRVVDLAYSLVFQMGFQPQNVEVEVVGLRQGEKTTESLVCDFEDIHLSDNSRIRVLKDTGDPEKVIKNIMDKIPKVSCSFRKSPHEHIVDLVCSKCDVARSRSLPSFLLQESTDVESSYSYYVDYNEEK